MALAITIFTFAGLAVIFGICIDEMFASARHQRWLEAEHQRRLNAATVDGLAKARNGAASKVALQATP